ncbi:MAG: S8 family serine peptidase [Haliscomenobacter sp.]|nr:S8 family serine peptidase [Haliscomenobacter sp.]MBK7474734.1 S8 family serine peptidase [Haliscomenobacter sp.]MBK8877617.1 S8 family serine peptidase [Haliscomenobacter sp.]
MIRKITFLVFLFLAVNSCNEEASQQESLAQPIVEGQATTPLPKSEINQFIERQLYRHNKFEWNMGDVNLIWSASVQSDSLMAIGYKPAKEQRVEERLHLINIQTPEWQRVRQSIIDLVVRETNREFPGHHYTVRDLMPLPDSKILPAIDIKIFSPTIIQKLREMPEVRYIEPLGYSPEGGLRSDSGCGSTAASSIPAADYTTISPSVKQSWHQTAMNIPGAWSQSTGSGITVALLDTGTSPSQAKLNGEFNSGQSSGRTHERLGTYVSCWFCGTPDGPNDGCGHGTQMAGLIAAPRGSGGTAVGAAYNCNLLSIRVTSDVVINGSSEKTGVADGLTIAANRSNVKIISMSIGDVISTSRVSDAVKYAYGKGKLIFAAAGTSLSWTSWWGVIFPANMAECVAITGVKEGLPLEKCNTCHEGSKVDFVAVMQRRSDTNRTALTLALSGNTPAYVGGSSAATATTAGIAAQVWATNPSMTRDQVVTKLKNASSLYPSRNANLGWGIIDASRAVAGI